jgi:hypothetical protein
MVILMSDMADREHRFRSHGKRIPNSAAIFRLINANDRSVEVGLADVFSSMIYSLSMDYNLVHSCAQDFLQVSRLTDEREFHHSAPRPWQPKKKNRFLSVKPQSFSKGRRRWMM